jgi:hypothetical protein
MFRLLIDHFENSYKSGKHGFLIPLEAGLICGGESG